MDLADLFPRIEDVPEKHDIAPLHQRHYLCGGELKPWNGPAEEVCSPVCMRNGKTLEPRVIGSFPSCTEKESMEALDAAVLAYNSGRGQWPTMAVEERIRCVQAFADRMKEKREEVIRLLMWEIGKSHADSAKEFDRTVAYIVDTIDALKELDRVSSRFTITEGIVAQIRRAPLGVVLCMGPFNYPLNETFTTLIPALIMGNSLILKPPRFGVLLYEPLLTAFRDSFPPGVINVIYGDGATVVTPLMKSGRIDVLAFIGSHRVADILKTQHPKPHRLRCALGMGAKNPAILLPDADLDLAVRETITGSLSFNGQRCTALKIIFVHRDIADDYLKRYCAALDSLKAGMPWEEGVSITPLPEPGKTGYLAGLVADAVEQGAKIANGAGGTFAGTLFRPAALYPVNETMRVYHEEQFGPVVPIVPFDDIEDPIEYVIGSFFGQQLSIFGRDSDTMARLIDPLVNQVCRVNINSQCQRGPDTFPFGGRKDSAEGTLSVTDALRVFSIRAVVAAKGGELNNDIIRDIVRNRKSNFLSTDFIL
ncbi:MAG: NADP-dependent glyceraldehyde-3-phosphate dehydrogenase [Spirochaetes bacterium]|nr:MAG: NADP-dependent glyceraldehyde-3-phosphate dehydrogenase [Spirochaetota bacterium]